MTRRFASLWAFLVLLASPAYGDTVVFGDLTHNSLGNATLSLTQPDELVVGNIGGSGLDGVSVELPDACAYFAHWTSLPPQQNGDLLRFRTYGEQGELVGTIWFEGNGADLELAVDLPPGQFPSSQMLVYEGSHLVYAGGIADAGIAALVERWPDDVQVESACSDAISNSVTFSWDSPVLVAVPVKHLGQADSIKIGSGAFGSLFTEFRIEAAGIPSIHLVESDYSLPGASAVVDPIPALATLGGNAPNPFNAHTQVHYALREPAWVSLVIYDTSGRFVKTLIRDRVDAGNHEAAWDGRDEAGRPVASGVYLYQLSVGDRIQTRRMALVK